MRTLKMTRPVVFLGLATALSLPAVADDWRGGGMGGYRQDYPRYTIPRAGPVMPTRPFFNQTDPNGNFNHGHGDRGDHRRSRGDWDGFGDRGDHRPGRGDWDGFRRRDRNDDDDFDGDHRHHGRRGGPGVYGRDGFNPDGGYGPYYSRPGVSIYYQSD